MSLVSVVVATYRREGELSRALASLAGQACDNFEIILVDDNGDTLWNAKIAAIVDSFRKRHPHIPFQYIVNQPNQGSARTRNIGIEAATGKYVTFLDDDDLYLPEKIARQAAFMESGSFDYSITDLDLYNDQDVLTDRRVRSFITDTTPEALLSYHLKHHLTGTDTMMFSRDYLTRIGCFAPIDVGDEFYLMQRAIDGGGKFGYLPGCDIKAYVHTGEGGLSSGDGKIAGENALFAFKQQYFPKLSPSTKRYITMRHYAVLAYAELRRKRFFKFMKYAAASFFYSPAACIKLFFSR